MFSWTMTKASAKATNGLAKTLMASGGACASCWYVYSNVSESARVWFIYHPIVALIGFGMIATASMAFRRTSAASPTYTKLHGVTMVLTTIAAIISGYVIYINKDIHGKPHLTSLHGYLGGGVLFTWLVSSIGLLFTLWPTNNGVREGKKEKEDYIRIKKQHRSTGKYIFATTYLTMALGWINLFGSPLDASSPHYIANVAFMSYLGALAWYVSRTGRA